MEVEAEAVATASPHLHSFSLSPFGSAPDEEEMSERSTVFVCICRQKPAYLRQRSDRGKGRERKGEEEVLVLCRGTPTYRLQKRLKV